MLLGGNLDAFALRSPASKNHCTPVFRTEVSRARYFNPGTGRFWTADTYEGNQEDPLSLHKYLYCRGNPINRIDPSGNLDLIEFNIVTAISVSLNLGSAAVHVYQGKYEALKWDALGVALALAGGIKLPPGMGLSAELAGVGSVTVPLSALAKTTTMILSASSAGMGAGNLIVAMNGSLSGGTPPQSGSGSGNNDDDSTPPPNLPFKSGEFIMQDYQTADGIIQVGAKAVVNGKELHMDQIAVFMKDKEIGDLGMSGVLTLRRVVAEQVKTLGFKKLRISGVRIEGSTSANPGKTPDVTIDLTR